MMSMVSAFPWGGHSTEASWRRLCKRRRFHWTVSLLSGHLGGVVWFQQASPSSLEFGDMEGVAGGRSSRHLGLQPMNMAVVTE